MAIQILQTYRLHRFDFKLFHYGILLATHCNVYSNKLLFILFVQINFIYICIFIVISQYYSGLCPLTLQLFKGGYVPVHVTNSYVYGEQKVCRVLILMHLYSVA